MKEQKKTKFTPIEISPDEPIYTTGVVCRLINIPVWVLKQLDRYGIVSPQRKKGKARLYSMRELKKLQKCWFYIKEHKVNIKGLKVILDMEKKLEK